MTQIKEANSPNIADPKPEDPKNKKPLRIRIHLLCDGTLNNKTNVAEREKSELEQSSESYSTHGDGDTNSYDNGRTNVAIMEPHVEAGKRRNGYDIVVKIYVEGQGTFDNAGDSFWGYSMGIGASGVYARARKGIQKALEALQQELFRKNPPEKFFIKQVDVDVFGFSRGAATARHAIHAMTTEETMTVTSPDGNGETIIVTHPLFERLRLLGYTETRADQIEIKFAGLYDTVVSVNASQLAPAWMANNTRDQRAVAKAKFALHLAAADEHRQDFPLHTIKSAKDAGTGAEYYLPGVHSDIGGSYNLANEKLIGNNIADARVKQLKGVGSYSKLVNQKQKLIAQGFKDADIELEVTAWYSGRGGRWPSEGKLYTYRHIEGVEYSRASDEIERVINRGRVSELEIDMANLKKDGWYRDDEIDIDTDYLATAVRSTQFLVNPLDAILDGSPLSGRLIVNRFGIKSAYSYIPLKIMVKHAREQGLQVRNKVDQRADITLADAGLQNLDADIQAYVASKGKTGSKPDDWCDIRTAQIHHADIKSVRNKHLHMSSRFKNPIADFGYTPRIKNNLRRRFYYEG